MSGLRTIPARRAAVSCAALGAAWLALGGSALAAHIIELKSPDDATAAIPAQPSPAPSPAPTAAVPKASDVSTVASYAAAMAQGGLKGPRSVNLGGRASLAFGSNLVFVGQPLLDAGIRAQGGATFANVLGIITSENGPAAFRAVISASSDGYIKAMPGLTASPDAALAAFREGRSAINAAMADHGFGAMEFLAWRVPPTYDAKKHTLDWTMIEREAGGTEVFCRHHALLDRNGAVAVDFFVETLKAADVDKIAAALAGGLSSDPAHAYGAFNAAKDASAPYGLEGLVAGADLKAPVFAPPKPKLPAPVLSSTGG